MVFIFIFGTSNQIFRLFCYRSTKIRVIFEMTQRNQLIVDQMFIKYFINNAANSRLSMNRVFLFVVFLIHTIGYSLADGIHLGYCDGKLPTSSMGQSGNGATISAALKITPEMLIPYTDCQITSLYIGLALDLSTYPDNITGWLRAERDGDNIRTYTIDAHGGWLTLQFDSPVEIADYVTSGIWVGFDYTQPKRLNLLAIGGPCNVEDACWVGKNGNWNDFSQYGVLPIEAVVEGPSVPYHDLSLLRCFSSSAVTFGSTINLHGTLRNNALQSVESPIIRLSYEGKEQSKALPVTLTYRQETEFDLSFQLDPADTQARDLIVDIEVLWPDGSMDENISDNSIQLAISLVEQLYSRRMVVEEGTGNECQWCVRGIVGLEEMKQQYPDDFIGIAVHYYTVNDPYYINLATEGSYSNYLSNYITSFPGCLINRDGSLYDPNLQALKEYYLTMDKVAFANVELQAFYQDNQIRFSSETSFLINDQSNEYRLAYVLIENQLPITQANGYSGGDAGPMGGFEEKPNRVDILVDDVARGIWPSATGAEGSLPAKIVKNEVYTHELTIDMPEYADGNNLEAIAILLNMTDGSIVNGTRCRFIDGLTAGIHQLHSEDIPSYMYNLRGQRTTQKKGIVVMGGQARFMIGK